MPPEQRIGSSARHFGHWLQSAKIAVAEMKEDPKIPFAALRDIDAAVPTFDEPMALRPERCRRLQGQACCVVAFCEGQQGPCGWVQCFTVRKTPSERDRRGRTVVGSGEGQSLASPALFGG